MGKYILIHGIRVAKDFVPRSFGRLATLGPAFMVGRRSFVVCLCSCGSVLITQTNALKQHTQSCGCLRSEITTKRNTAHGKSKTAEYQAWKNMKKRCLNPNATQYKDWGGRGIKICDRWLGESGFSNFLADMGNKPSEKHSIDRINVDGNYCPENCRWATAKHQANNTRRNRMLSAFGRVQTLSEWAAETGVAEHCVRLRIDRYNWSTEKALSTPHRSSTLKEKPNGSQQLQPRTR